MAQRFKHQKEKTMTKKTLFAVSLLPLLAISAVAHAGTTISDQRYWPNSARPIQQVVSPAYADAQANIGALIRETPKSCSYQGGPRTGSLVCR